MVKTKCFEKSQKLRIKGLAKHPMFAKHVCVKSRLWFFNKRLHHYNYSSYSKPHD